MKYYLGSYYLYKIEPADFGTIKGSKIFTCSSCINKSYLDSWSISWSEDGKNISDIIRKEFKLSEELINKIHKWTDNKLEQNKIGWINNFYDLNTVLDYKKSFFKEEKELQILSINFPETEKNQALNILSPTNKKFGEIGIYQNLKKEIKENTKEEQLGFDLIGIEPSGDFHSFHCHDLKDELISEFGIKINNNGLIQENKNWKEIVNYMNHDDNGFEPVPWFFVKINQVQTAST
ncbi:hypothetical protein ACNI3T_04830 [Christiangramia sp. ASW11-125]|uniref:hypothetical protein n=1 Tax=Christiangramia sp. ASW11-125 TaxID=3400701 RepID=UPI003AAFE485